MPSPNRPVTSADLDSIVDEMIANANALDKSKKHHDADIWRNAVRIISRKRLHVYYASLRPTLPAKN